MRTFDYFSEHNIPSRSPSVGTSGSGQFLSDGLPSTIRYPFGHSEGPAPSPVHKYYLQVLLRSRIDLFERPDQAKAEFTLRAEEVLTLYWNIVP